MFCPVCKGEFREGFTRCNECNVDLVENLDDIKEKVEGEFLLCPHCHREFRDNEKSCPDCGFRLCRAVLNKDNEYVFLEGEKFETGDYTAEFKSVWKYYTEIDLSKSAVVLETMDNEMLKKVMDLLNKNAINFMFVEPSEAASTLGSVFGMNSPLERPFPKIVVREEDEEKALSLVANSPELGLFDVPEELISSEEEEEEEDEE